MMRWSLILFVAAALFAPASAQSNFWKEVAVPPPMGSVYTFVDFSDSLSGVLCSDDGSFTVTGDRGRSWTAIRQITSGARVVAVKMADSVTLLVAALPATGNTKVYRITPQGARWESNAGIRLDSLELPIALIYGVGTRGTISILNKERIGYVDRDRGKFFSTPNFGQAWDSLEVTTKFHTSVQALDSVTLFLATGTGIIGLGNTGSLARSDDNGKTFVSIDSDIDDANIRIFTKEFACFDISVESDLYGGYRGLILYNLVTKQSTRLGGFTHSVSGLGTYFQDGSSVAISSSSHLVPAGDSLYIFGGAAATEKDSLRYATIAIGSRQSVWYLTQEGRLFTYANDPLLAQGTFPLQMGNRWQYQSTDVMHPSPMVESRIVGDTVMANGKRYAYMTHSMLGSPFLREEGRRVYAYDLMDSAEYVLFDFQAKPNDTLGTHGKGQWTDVAAGRILIPESPLAYWRFFEYRNAGPTGYIFADWTIEESVGLVWMTGEPGNGWTLSGAVINGGTIGTVTSVRQEAAAIPVRPVLQQNYPNPFNPSTTIAFTLPAKARVSLKIFDVMGRCVATLASGEVSAGTHQVQWNASAYPSGVYFYRLQAGAYTETKRLTLVK